VALLSPRARRLRRCARAAVAGYVTETKCDYSRCLSPRPIVPRASPAARDDAVIPPYPPVRASAAPNRRRARSLRSRPTAVYRVRIDDESAMPQHKRHRIAPESCPWAAHLRDLYRLGHCWVSPKSLWEGWPLTGPLHCGDEAIARQPLGPQPTSRQKRVGRQPRRGKGHPTTGLNQHLSE
jgi:hypothetical protein